MAEMLIVVSKVKNVVKVRVGRDALESLSAEVGKLIKQAEKEAQSDGMETIKERHVQRAVASLGAAAQE